jgi:glycosyltransferase involved in cell wall biosynthesis
MSDIPIRKPKIIAGIPAYNNGLFIAEVVLRAKEFVDRVFVVDDGSTDSTARIAEAAGASVLAHGKNRGYGESIKSCFTTAKANDADILVILDGDGQHNPDEISQVLAPILDSEADLVTGSRFLQLSQLQTADNHRITMPRYRQFGVKVITFLYNFGHKTKVSDAQSGFRAYNRRVLDKISLTERGMGVSVEVIIEARRRDFRIKEVPISCSYHSGSSTLNPLTHGLDVAFAVIKLRLRSFLRSFKKAKLTQVSLWP